ncbi:MAG: TolC family protein [Ignavibacteria bacterium]|nr:TolC family protein [Ignavibacteria bacterium]
MMNTINFKYIIALLMFFAGSYISAQDNSVSLKECYNLAYKNYPEAKQTGLYSSSNELKMKNLNTNYYPQITFKGLASYQSDVPTIVSNVPFFQPPEPPKDHFQVTMDVSQLIYDGGNTSAFRDVETAQMLLDQQKVEVDLYSLRTKINDLYFSVILLQEKQKIYETLRDDILTKIKEVESKVKNEALTPSNLYSLQAQLIQTEQEISSVIFDKQAAVKMLGELIGSDISHESVFSLPETGNVVFDNKYSNRPEYRLFDLQKNQISALDEVTDSRIIPKISAFGTAGYGKPGLNILEDAYEPFYMVGLNLSWTPVNWGRNSNEKQINSIRKNIVETQRETFDKNLKVVLEKYKSDISKFDDLLVQDREVLSLREKIIASVYSQFLNGTVTSTVYITELNNKTQSELVLQTHIVQLLQSKINYLTAKGDF